MMQEFKGWYIAEEEAPPRNIVLGTAPGDARLSTLLSSLADNCKDRRVRANCKQRELAQKAEVSYDAVRRIESGRSVSVIDLLKVLHVLGLADDLVTLIGSERGLSNSSPLEPLRKPTRKRVRSR